jgi:hypothetical protein
MNKFLVVQQLKSAWKAEVQKQYLTEPDKVRNADIQKNTNEMISNLQVRIMMKSVGIKKEDVFAILSEIKEEVIREHA